ncbi:AAA family ATPase [Pseudoalteromonas sp. SS15]|uniref:AAA family ATPase n=1 Tax=Pseudoalteromonas sp. SS15 TaxID=3139393 RepID=UPI003BA85AFF
MYLTDLNLENHNIFGSTSIPLGFNGENIKNRKTILIGQNGCGKSNLLECIADALTIEFSEDKDKAAKDLQYDYDLLIDDNINNKKISRQSKKQSIQINKLLAITSTSQDRFPFINKNSIRYSSQYIYLGMKTTTNNIFFSTLKESILLSLVKIYGDPKKIDSSVNVLEELGFSEDFDVSLKKGRNFKLFNDRFVEGKEEVSSKERLDSKSFNKYINTEFSKTHRAWARDAVNKINSGQWKIQVKLKDKSNHDNKVKYLEFITELLKNNVLSIDTLSLFSSSGYDMNQASSGEFNILKIFLSIIANVEDNSVVLIDEPEISLHPNWQIEFSNLLDIALSAYKGCHSIIATHSHFILSNVSSENSLILKLNPCVDSRQVEVTRLDLDSYGWSPEQTLYRVFGTTGYRNKYLELDLRIIIDFLSEPSKDPQEFKEAISRVEKFNFESTDPLSVIITKAKKLSKELGD